MKAHKDTAKKRGPKPRPGLSAKQMEILKRLATGACDKDVAREFNISVPCAFFHRHEIFKKLHVQSCIELVHYAIRKEIVPLMEFSS